MKIAVLCNSRMAQPAVVNLLNKKKISALGIADNKADVIPVYEHYSKLHNVPLTVFTRKKFGTQLREWLEAVAPDVVLVMTFPFRIPASLLAIPEYGFINFHYGLLPEMRGADPIFESIRQRKAVAGTTVHYMDAGYDTGNIIMREEIAFPQHFTYGMLGAQLAMQGDEMCKKLLVMLEDGTVPSSPQDENKATYYPALKTEEVYLDWQNTTAADLIALINACNPMSKNGAPTVVNGWTLGICDASIINLQGDTSAYTPGSILTIDPQNGFLVMTKDGFALKLEVIYTEEGYFPGYKMASFGIGPGMTLTGMV